MNPFHEVLQNDYLVQIICHFILEDPFKQRITVGDSQLANKLKKLLAFALVCPLSGTYGALSVLWREPSFNNIYCLFPAVIVSANAEDRKSFTRNPVTLGQWSRFDIYSRWIRVLTPSFSWDNEIALCAALACHPRRRHPFSNLTCLNLYMDASLISHATVLLCPTLTSVDIRLRGAEHDDRVADVVWAIQETCPRLEEFTYFPKILSRSRAAPLDEALTSLIRRSFHLRRAFVPAFHDMLDALGHLPRLSELSVYDGSTSISYPIEDTVLQGQDFNHRKFMSLDSLTIFAPPLLQSLTECFRNSGCFARKKFYMEINTFNPDIDRDEWLSLGRRLADFFRVVLEPNPCSELQTFQVSTEKPFTRVPDSWERFKHPLSLRNLQHVAFGEFFLDINDLDIEEITHAWPNLHSLELTIPPMSNYRSQITFQGLAYLSSLPNLRHLSLTLGSGSTIFPPTLPVSLVPWESPISTSPLTAIEIRGDVPQDINSTRITLFLVKLFPELITIIAPDGRSQVFWASVQAGLDVTRSAYLRLRDVSE